MKNLTLILTCPPGDKLCFDTRIIPTGLFYMGKMDNDQLDIMKGNIPISFRLLSYLLLRNQHLFEVENIVEELIGQREMGEASKFISLIFEYDLEEVIYNIHKYLEELVEDGYLDYLYLRN